MPACRDIRSAPACRSNGEKSRRCPGLRAPVVLRRAPRIRERSQPPEAGRACARARPRWARLLLPPDSARSPKRPSEAGQVISSRCSALACSDSAPRSFGSMRLRENARGRSLPLPERGERIRGILLCGRLSDVVDFRQPMACPLNDGECARD